MKKLFKLIISVCLLATFAACDDMHDREKEWELTPSGESTQLFILSEGLIHMNNSTLSYYNRETGELKRDLFGDVNARGLGDTGNDMGLYGSKLYVVVNVSSQVEVIDINTGLSVRRIPILNEKGQARQPRSIAFYEGKAYVSAFDGTVTRIDTLSLEKEALVQCGYNPDGLCIAKGKLYVANSGGLNFPNYDNRVSVIDLSTFTEIKKIEVGMNPTRMAANSAGDVYLISNGNYGQVPATLQKIDTQLDELNTVFENIHPLNFCIQSDTAYIIHQDEGAPVVMRFDCITDTLIDEHFISDGTALITPYGIDVDARSGDVYITDVYSYTIWGDVLCFDAKGKLRYRINEVGLNPRKVIVL